MPALPTRRLFLCGFAAAVIACSPSPNAPAPPATTTPGTTTNPQLRAVRILNAPANVHIGSSGSARAVAEYADGSFVDVTNTATWRSSDSACRVGSGGVIEAAGGGVAEIIAEFGGLDAKVSVACGYFITVSVHENAPTEHVAVPGAVGEILDGPHAGRTFITDASGRAALPPVSGAGFYIQFKKPGFENFVYQVRQLPLEARIDIPMVPEYTAQVVFQGQCSSASFQRLIDNYNFTTGRTGKIRMRVELRSDGLAPFADLFGTIEGTVGQARVHADVDERPLFGPNRPIAEMRVDAGDYRMSLAAMSGCSPTDFWHVTLEYSR